jgi:hypothetical protein
VLKSLLSCDSLVRVIVKHLGKEMNEFLRGVWDKFLNSDPFLCAEVPIVWLHMGSLAFEPIQKFWVGRAKDLIDPMNLI